MRLTSKCLVIALSALFAGTPAVPAGAAPLPVVNIQPVEKATGVQLVDHRIYPRRHWRGNDRQWRRGHDPQWGRDREWRGNRQWGRHQGRHYRDRWYPRGRYDNWRGERHGRYYRHRDNAWVPLAIMGMGAMIGSSMANERRVYSGGRTHVSWCANRYRSYRAYDNTFQPYNGPRRQCYSPYR